MAPLKIEFVAETDVTRVATKTYADRGKKKPLFSSPVVSRRIMATL